MEISDLETVDLRYIKSRTISNEHLMSSYTSTYTTGSIKGEGKVFYRYVAGSVDHKNYIRVYVRNKDDGSIELRELPAKKTKIYQTKGVPRLQTYNKIYHPVYSLLFEHHETSEEIKTEYYRLYIPEGAISEEYSFN